MIVQSLGALAGSTPPWATGNSYGSVMLNDGYARDYATLYRTQSNVRTVVDFLARNIAQLGLHVYRRVSETDRERLRDHPLARLVGRPNPATTRYRLINSLVTDLGIFDNAYWLKLPDPNGGMALLRVPPQYATVYGGLIPTSYTFNLGQKVLKGVDPADVVHFRGHNPDSAIAGLSPLESLRGILAEEAAASDFRAAFWRNSARMGGVISRPANAPEWTEPERVQFRADFEALYTGALASGRTAILEDGMTWEQTSSTFADSEYLGARKLTREEVARAYHVPLPMVGILDHATFSNITEQHKNLYQDTLGPWLAMVEDEIALQLVGDFPDSDNVYVEFNIQEKLQGSFEEQAQALQSAVGRPWMTANEARAKQNLPALGSDAAGLVTPLNVLVGGQASPRDSAPQTRMPAAGDMPMARKALDEPRAVASVQPALRDRHAEKWGEVLGGYLARQQNVLAAKMGGRDVLDLGHVWDGNRWERELTDDLLKVGMATAEVFGREAAKAMDVTFEPALVHGYVLEGARRSAKALNEGVRDALATALRTQKPAEALKTAYAAVDDLAKTMARTRASALANFGALEAAKQAHLTTKTWRADGEDSRHAALDGVTLRLDEPFAEGMQYPGDLAGGIEQTANCRCVLAFGRGD